MEIGVKTLPHGNSQLNKLTNYIGGEPKSMLFSAQNIKHKTPWWIKIPLKIILSRLPILYVTWSKLGYFKHGEMKSPEYAHNVFKHHYDRAASHVDLNDFTVLELGPGDSLFTAIVANAFGARQCHLVDTSYFANSDLQIYRQMAEFISEKAMPAPAIMDATTLEELLSICNAYYGTCGLETLRTLPDKSIDFVFSQAVLEHIRKQDFLEHLQQMRRIIKDDGICSHSIDLKDHLGGNLNNLRFSEELWESNLFTRSGFYTNRIRYSEMLDLFKQARFSPELIQPKYWPKLPTAKKKLSGEFKNLSDRELLISDFDVILRPVL